MKRTLCVVLTLAIIGMFCVTPVAAATSQGLEWGVALGHRVDYTMTSTEEDVPSEDMYVNVTKMPALAIPDPLDDWDDIPDDFNLGFWWANGTDMGLIAIIFIGLLTVGSKFVVPIGNFTHLEELLKPELTGETITTETNLWRVVWKEDTTATEELRITAAYAIADGFLSEYKLETWSTLNDTLLSSISIIRPNIPSGGMDIIGLLMDNILYVGIGVAVIVIVGGVVCMKRR